MGTKDPPAIDATIAGVLFTPVQRRLLGLLFGQPGRRYQGAELIRLAASGTGGAHRLLTRLVQVGLVTVEPVGNQKFYQANAESPVFAELSGLVRKTVGLAVPLREALAPLAGDIHAAFVYGSLAKGGERAGSDVDLMVISDGLDYASLYAVMPGAESALARPVNPTLMTRDEWRRKRDERDGFIARIAVQPKVFVIGSEDDLE
jgi:predicted nucleotidyltransferase